MLRDATFRTFAAVRGGQPLTFTLDCIDMDSHTILAKLKSHVASAPEMRGRGQFSSEHFEWLAKASALVEIWKPMRSMPFNSACDFLASGMNREHNFATIMGILHRAIATLEQTLPVAKDQVFGPGAVYDFFVALRSVISSAKESLFLIDPYMDDQIFDAYLSPNLPSVSVRILCNRYSASVKTAAAKFMAQTSTRIEARSTSSVHDRLLFVDNAECWVMGASIKDAASKPTYLAPLSPDISEAKLAFYETIWGKSGAI